METGEIRPTQPLMMRNHGDPLETGELIPTQQLLLEENGYFNDDDLEIPQEPESKIELNFPSECQSKVQNEILEPANDKTGSGFNEMKGKIQLLLSDKSKS